MARALLLAGGAAACGPVARIPARPLSPLPVAAAAPSTAPTGGAPVGPVVAPVLPTPESPAGSAAAAATEAQAALARALAPVLFLHPREPFPLERVVAVLHPTRPLIAYHLLWRDDAYGAWIPGTMPTDEEIVWVGYDATGAPTRLWTYWHGTILSAPWAGRQVAVDVQWGKHGSLPHGTPDGALPRARSLRAFHALTWALPDLWLGKLNRPGPGCFCGSYDDYRRFTVPVVVAERLDAVVVAEDPRRVLGAVFGVPYSDKTWWPAVDPVAPRS